MSETTRYLYTYDKPRICSYQQSNVEVLKDATALRLWTKSYIIGLISSEEGEGVSAVPHEETKM